MAEEEIKLLKKALELYKFVIEQRRTDSDDSEEANKFYYMQESLSKVIGQDIFV